MRFTDGIQALERRKMLEVVEDCIGSGRKSRRITLRISCHRARR
jgi:hypothetical protein